MAEPRTRWGQIIVEKVDALGRLVETLIQRVEYLDRRVENLDQRVENLDQRVKGLDQRVEDLDQRVKGLDQRVGGLEHRTDRLEETLKDLIAQMQHLAEQSAFTAATARWTAGLAIVLGPLLLIGASWLAWYTAVLGQRIEHQGEAIVEQRVELKTVRSEVDSLRVDMNRRFDRLEAALEARAAERTE